MCLAAQRSVQVQSCSRIKRARLFWQTFNWPSLDRK